MGVNSRLLSQLQRLTPVVVLATTVITVGLRLVGAFFADVVPTKTAALKYHQELGMGYTARVSPTPLYLSPTLQPGDLPRWQVQADPPAYRRSILLPPLQLLTVEFPYKISFDRPVHVSGTVSVQGFLAAPRLWQQPVYLGTPMRFSVHGPVAEGFYRIDLDLKAYADRVTAAYEEGGMAPGNSEIWIDLSLDWQATAEGLSPVNGSLPTSHYIIGLFPGHVEVEEHDPARQDQTIYVTGEQPNVITLPFGWVRVSEWKRVTGRAAAVMLLPALWAIWVLTNRKQRPPADAKLRRMPQLIEAHPMELAWVLEVRVKGEDDLLRIHATSGQPILRTLRGYHVIVEQICYTLEPPTE